MNSPHQTLPIAVSMGEPAGIGGEILLKAWLQRDIRAVPPFFTIDDPERLIALNARLGLNVPVHVIGTPAETATTFERALPVLSIGARVKAEPGLPHETDAFLVLESIRRAVEFCQKGLASALTTNPINKALLYQVGFTHPGHTEFVAELCGGRTPVMMLAVPDLRVVPVTIHQSLASVPESLTAEKLRQVCEITHDALRQDFGIARPRIAVAGLNPHAGERGKLGTEDEQTIAPVVQELADSGMAITGPLPADTMFHAGARQSYDVAICMYHDQALIPVKTIDFDNGVNATLGLPIIRTSPDHGTAFDIAGTGRAKPDSLIAALKMAGDMAASRQDAASA